MENSKEADNTVMTDEHALKKESSEEYVAIVKVKNRMGLHTRPATAIVKMLQNVPCDVHFTCKKATVNAKSILSILMLAAPRNTRITITTKGQKAQAVLAELVDAFENKFGE